MKKWRRGKGTAQKVSDLHICAEIRPRTHVDRELTEIRVELTRDTQASRDAGHDDGDEVVEVTVRGGGELQCPEADVVEGLVINAESLVRVLDELVDGERGVVGLAT